MLRVLLYFSVFISIRIWIHDYTYEAFHFFHGYIESLLLTGLMVTIIEVSEKRFNWINAMPRMQFNLLFSSSYILLLALLIYMISKTTISADGNLESTVLYTFTNLRSWAGNDARKSLIPMVGVIGFALTSLALLQMKSQVFSKSAVLKKALSLIPILLFYLLLYLRIAHISIPAFKG